MWRKITDANVVKQETLERALEDVRELDLLGLTAEECNRIGFLKHQYECGVAQE